MQRIVILSLCSLSFWFCFACVNFADGVVVFSRWLDFRFSLFSFLVGEFYLCVCVFVSKYLISLVLVLKKKRKYIFECLFLYNA